MADPDNPETKSSLIDFQNNTNPDERRVIDAIARNLLDQSFTQDILSDLIEPPIDSISLCRTIAKLAVGGLVITDYSDKPRTLTASELFKKLYFTKNAQNSNNKSPVLERIELSKGSMTLLRVIHHVFNTSQFTVDELRGAIKDNISDHKIWAFLNLLIERGVVTSDQHDDPLLWINSELLERVYRLPKTALYPKSLNGNSKEADENDATTTRRKVLLVEGDKDWMVGAVCDGLDQDLFFPERGASNKEAKSICRGCEVRFECLNFAIENHIIFGIWGGYSESERSRIRQSRAIGAKK
ncbi:MAG: WhiB family transcriptional regulator [Patescibacteria group bacterium]